MQTFLPYPEFQKTLAILDYKRLGKQRVEAKTLIHIIEKIYMKENNSSIGWLNHPITVMWTPYLTALKHYYNLCVEEWIRRGYKNNMPLYEIEQKTLVYPEWLGTPEYHLSHRSNLLRKDFPFYSKKFKEKDPTLPYLWHTNDKGWYFYDPNTKKRVFIDK